MTALDELDAATRPRLWRAAKFLLFLVTEGAAVLLIAFAALFVNLQPAWSAGVPPAGVARPGDAKSGSLLLKSEDGYTEAIRLGVDVDLTVSGPTIRAKVTQLFRNPSKDWVEAVYVYPLPPGGAVDTLKMIVGDRVVVGEIKERQQARAIYEQAKASGQKAALTEQERPNIFTNSVANIGPGETVLVQIEYQEPVHQTGNTFSLRVPMVVAPRYNPAPIVQSVEFKPNGGGWGATATDPVPDRDRITPPVLDPRENAPVNPTAITVRLQAGFPLGEVKSHHHQVNTEKVDGSSQIIRLAEGVVPADRDFELTWTPAAEKAPSIGLFREHVGDADYLLAYVTPPSVDNAQQKPMPREVIFVIDNSGSMGGTSMVQAKASLLYALGRLQPGDRFNVIRFDNTMTVLFPTTVPADAGNIARANAYVGALQAEGGTEMLPAMRAALSRRQSRGHVLCAPGGVPDGWRDRQRGADVRDHLGAAWPLAHLHGRHRLCAQHLPDDARRRTRPRRLHPYRLDRPGGGADARVVLETGESGGDGTVGQVLRGEERHDAGRAARRLSRRAAGAGDETRQARRAPSSSRAASATGRGR